MSNLFDYLHWRGDLILSQSKFNNIDALILARLSYLAFDGIVPSNFSESISIKEASSKFFAQDKYTIEKNLVLEDDLKLLKEVSKSDRFKNLQLLGYVNEIDTVTEKQFSVVTIDINNKYFVAFRGTDNTLVGWKEDFNMSFMTTVPAQISAKNYLNNFSKHNTKPLIIAGHSKGGNLAVYSASFCNENIQKRIEKVYNFDGPGFNSVVLQKQGYQNIVNKINTFIPQSSVVGILLEHEEDYFVIHSTQEGILQHDLYSWEIIQTDFIYLNETTKDSAFLNQTLKDWLINTDETQREEFFDIIHKILLDTNADSITALNTKWYKAAIKIITSYSNLDEKSKEMVSATLNELKICAKNNLKIYKPKLSKYFKS